MTPIGTDRIVAKVVECGVLADVPVKSFSCVHCPAVDSEELGQTGLEFYEFGPHHVSLRFMFRESGDVILSGCPNRWAAERLKDILGGKSESAKRDLLAFTLESIPVIKQTLLLYVESIPHEDYAELLRLWSHVRPVLHDEPVEAHERFRWWRFS